MALRFMQVFLPEGREDKLDELLAGHELLGIWRDANVTSKMVVHLLVEAEQTEPIMDRLEQHFSGVSGFHVVLFPIEAVLPRPAPPAPPPDEQGLSEEPDEHRKPIKGIRVSREELYHDIAGSLGAGRVYLALAVLSSVVSAVGLVYNDLAVLVGAMVIAPLLGPNVALSLAVILGDIPLVRKALFTNMAGVSVALIPALAYGLIFPVDLTVPAIADRTTVDFANIALALGAGAAGTFAYTGGLAGAVIGVMVAVALVPPLVVFGMLLGAGHVGPAIGALMLTAANVICVNLAGTLTFAVQGVRPRQWWEARRARRATRTAIFIWGVLLIVLTAIIWFTETVKPSEMP